MWLILLGVLGSLTCVVIALEFRKRKRITTTVLSGILSVLIAFATLAYPIWRDENADDSENEPAISVGNDTSGTVIYVNGDVPGNITSVGGDYSENNTYNNYIKPEEISLAAACRKLEIKDYASAADIYLKILEATPENTIALCNLGYLFANGLGTEGDLQQALEYYDQAIKYGSFQALRNELALCLENDVPIERIAELIQTGLRVENIEICKFVAASMQDDESITVDDAISFCSEIQEIPVSALWSWEKDGLVRLYSTPTSTNILRYTYVSSGSETSETSAAMYTIYQTEKRFCPYIHLLQAGFDKTV